jgi:phytol kinase
MSNFFSVAFPPVLLFSAMGMLSRISSGRTITKELKRKALHIGVGMTALAFPFFLDSTWKVVVALGTALAWLLAVRVVPILRRHFGSVLHGVRRRSLGEVYFALSIAVLLLLTQGSPVFFVIPVLILTLADASAAIAGKLYPVGRLSGFARGKTVIGCSAFFAVAILVSFASLTFLTDLSLRDAILLATVLAGTTCLVEAVSRRGIDNLAIPAVAYLILVIVNPGGLSKHLGSNPLMAALQ